MTRREIRNRRFWTARFPTNDGPRHWVDELRTLVPDLDLRYVGTGEDNWCRYLTIVFRAEVDSPEEAHALLGEKYCWYTTYRATPEEIRKWRVSLL